MTGSGETQEQRSKREQRRGLFDAVAKLYDELTPLRESTLFGETVEANHVGARRLPVATVAGLERTRATFLSYSEQHQAGFTAELRALLAHCSDVDLAQETFLAMAPVAAAS